MERIENKDEGDRGCAKVNQPKRKRKWGSRVSAPRKSHKATVKKPSQAQETVEAGSDVQGASSRKRKYIKQRVSMPKRRRTTNVVQTPFAVTEIGEEHQAGGKLVETIKPVKLVTEQNILLEDRPQETQLRTEEPHCSLASHISQLKEDEFCKDVIWSAPVDPHLSFESSETETADEEDQVCDDHPTHPACHHDNLETIPEENPYSAVLIDLNIDPQANTENTKSEGKITVPEFIAFTLNALLPCCWTVNTNNNCTVRIVYLSPFENVAVQRAVVWNGEDIKIFVHNRPLPSNNYIWPSAVVEDRENIGEICDVLLRVATLLQFQKSCSGIKLHESQWKKAEEQGKGSIEIGIYEEFKCFRHTDCSLLTAEHARCGNCHNLQRNMKDQVRRSNEASVRDPKKINDRYLTMEEKNKKLDDLENEKKALQKKYNRIRNRVQKLIESKSCNVSNDSSQDLARLFQEEYEHMTKVERIFWSEQLKALSCQRKNSLCMRWNPFIIKVALNIRMRTSTEGYKYLIFFVKLPSDRLLYDYTHAVQAKDGIQDETVRNLVEQTQEYKEEHLKYFNIEFDEMHVRSDIVIDKKTGDIIGYAHLRKVEKDLADMEAEISSSNFSPSLAKTVLVFLVQGVSNPLLGVVGIYPSKDLSSSQLFSRVWDVIYTMESCGLKVLSLICDGAAMNKKFFRIHPGVDALQVGSDNVYATKNLAATEERLLYFMVDPPHLLKTLRNCLANSYCHKKSRKMWKNNEDLSWVTIEKLYAISAQDKYSPHKLTRAHIKLTPFSCMKVILATQTMSGSVARELKNLKDHEALAGCYTSELSHFLQIVNDGFDCFNGSGDVHGKRNKVNSLLLPYTSKYDSRFKWLLEKYLRFFQDWKNDTKQRKGNYTSDAREKMCVSHQAFESLHITTYGFISAVQFMLSEVNCPAIDAKKFNQDKLEQYFGILRMSGGGSRSLSVDEVRRKAVKLQLIGNATKPPSKGNTTVQEEEWIPDERSLPRKKK
ncbi:DNA transposase [Frankliniella fusca]|uniref:DNA transposase n=1 Tax=Frankliniella fusca TaxID=407009 RepID=A0AAE1HN03_9NEOP|nr:DNA transposase [Frankliniella fusca]